ENLDGLRFDLDHLETLGKFQSIIISMESLYAEIWTSLTEEGRDEFLSEYAERFLAFRSPIPVFSAKKIIEGVDAGHVEIYKDVKEINRNEDHFEIKFKSSIAILQVDYLLNGTGQTTDLNENRHVEDQLIQQLLNERILT